MSTGRLAYLPCYGGPSIARCSCTSTLTPAPWCTPPGAATGGPEGVCMMVMGWGSRAEPSSLSPRSGKKWRNWVLQGRFLGENWHHLANHGQVAYAPFGQTTMTSPSYWEELSSLRGSLHDFPNNAPIAPKNIRKSANASGCGRILGKKKKIV